MLPMRATIRYERINSVNIVICFELLQQLRRPFSEYNWVSQFHNNSRCLWCLTRNQTKSNLMVAILIFASRAVFSLNRLTPYLKEIILFQESYVFRKICQIENLLIIGVARSPLPPRPLFWVQFATALLCIAQLADDYHSCVYWYCLPLLHYLTSSSCSAPMAPGQGSS